MYTKVAFGAAKAVLFIGVPLIQGVFIREVPLYTLTIPCVERQKKNSCYTPIQ